MANDLCSSIARGVSISLLQKYNGFLLMIIMSIGSDLWSVIEKRRRHLRGSVAKNKEGLMRHNAARAGAARTKHGAKEGIRSTTCASVGGHLVFNVR